MVDPLPELVINSFQEDNAFAVVLQCRLKLELELLQLLHAPRVPTLGQDKQTPAKLGWGRK